ncbi:MAG: beta-glucuronidase [Eubacterium sp.]|jgi:beta-glucuronidase
MLYPVMTDSRMVIDLSGVWDFKLDDGNGFTEKWYEKPLTDPIAMPVPSSYNDIRTNAEIRDHYGYVFYQRYVSLPEAVRNTQRIVLRMDAVTHHAIVYLNGEKICEHFGGFLPFEAEITEKLKDGRNLLTIAVDNVVDYTTLPVGGQGDILGDMMGTSAAPPQKKVNRPNFDFFNYCGITRPVRIYTTPAAHIEDVTVTSDVPEISAAASNEDSLMMSADLHYKVDVVGDGACSVEVYDEKGTLVGKAEGTEGTVHIEKAHLWQPLHAYLYNIRFRFASDVYELPYGIRTVRVDGTKFLINEKPFYFKGYGKHEDTFPNGRGINIPMYVKDISLMKWQGANSFRTSHYPYSEEMVRLCDREGLVLIDETTAVGINFDFGGGANFNGQKVSTFDPDHGVKTFEHHKDVIRDLIARDKNHACVVMWSIANEPDSYSKGAYEYFAPLYALAREMDPQKRPCTLASVQLAGGPDRDISAKLSDVICLNRYYGWYYCGSDLESAETALRKELDAWAALGKPVIFTEYGADTVMGLHDATPVMFTEEYQVDFYRMYSKVFDEYPCVVGEQVWNFADFETSQGIVRVQGNKKGLFTRDRRPKLAAHYFRCRWNSIPDFGYKK